MKSRNAVLLVLFAAGCQLPYGGPGSVVLGSRGVSPPDSVDVGAVEREIVDEVNDERDGRDVPEVAVNAAMTEAARLHAQELAARHELDHASIQPGRETFAQRLALAGAPEWTLAGENLIQLPFVASDVADEAVAGWLGSPSHRSQMLEASFTDTGVGVARDAHGDWFIVQLFIRRR